jgi:hypothetical protein
MSNNSGTNFTPSATGKSGWSTGGLGDLVGFIPGIGFNLWINGKPINGPTLGGGIKGIMPQAVQNVNNYNDFAQTRLTLREVWNTENYNCNKGGCAVKANRRIVTPFRAVTNAGDTLSRQNYSCGGTCQSFQSRPGLNGLRQRFGSISNACTADVFYSGKQIDPLVPAAACNVKFVYDSSDYITYLKQKAVNKNYNDRSYGGNDYLGAQVATRAIRRY